MYSPQSHVLVAARADEALTHGQVMYGLIKPTKEMDQVESTAAMVNVIPKKRIYVMEKAEELELFTAELFKRPLVLQPSAHIGRGLAAISCTMFTKEEKWIVLVNQSHPKILGRIKMGMDLAKQKFIRGEPFILELSLNSFLKRVYLDRLTKASLDPRFTFIEFQDAVISIRYRGDKVHRGVKWEFRNPPVTFEFEDLLPGEIVRRTVTEAQNEWQNPALRVIKPAEIGRYLPGWSFEQIDPLEAAMTDPPPEYEEEAGAVGGEDLPPGYEDIDLDEHPRPSAPPMPSAPQGRIMGRAQRKAAAAGAKYSVPVELHVPEPEGPQVLHTGYTQPLPVSPLGSRSPDDRYISSPMMPQDRYSPGNSRDMYRDQNKSDFNYSDNSYGQQGQRSVAVSPDRYQGQISGSRTPDRTYTPNEEHAMHRQTEQYSPRSPKSPNNLRGGPDNYRQYPISPNVKEINQPARSTYLTDDDDEGGFSPSYRSRTPQTLSPNYTNSSDYRNLPQNERVSPSPRNENMRLERDLDRPSPLSRGQGQPSVTPSPRGQGQPSGRPVAPPRSFHRHQGSGRSESGSDSGFGESDNHIHIPTKMPYYNHAYEKDSPEKDQSMDDILAKHKALAAKMLQQQGQGQGSGGQGHYERLKGRDQGHYDRLDRNDNYDQASYNKELQRWRQNINNLEDACHGPVVEFSQGQEMEESVI